MIIVRSPLRISLGGGGTDLPSYYKKKGGFVISAAINKYIYISISKRFVKGILIKYSKIEECETVDQIEHPIIREVLKYFVPHIDSIEIDIIADIPSGTGLGSSGSFTTGLIKAISTFINQSLSDSEVAKLACYIEIEKLLQPIGKQDQFISSYGGITSFRFESNDDVIINPVLISQDTIYDLEDNLLLFFTGFNRSASDILIQQVQMSNENNVDIFNNLDHTKYLGFKCLEYLENGETYKFGELMHDHWVYKKSRTENISNSKIDDFYNLGINNGAVGGKLVGAGGGGFLMFFATDSKKLRNKMNELGLPEVRFTFDMEGVKILLN